MLDEGLVPHDRSPGHPETAAMEVVIARYRAEGTAYRTLHDGQALVINGPDTAIG
jgi:dipeptidase E